MRGCCAGRAVLLVLVLVLGAVLVWLASISVRIWWDARGQDTTVTDAIVVLGAAQYDGTPSPVFEQRLLKAQQLYEDDVAPVIVTTGGRLEGDRLTEAEAGEDYLVAQGVPADDVIALPVGNSTSESIEAVALLFDDEGWSSATIVTDPWHTFRSKAIAEDYGIEAHSAPVQGGPVAQSRATQARYIIRETAAYAWWTVFGDAEIAGPDATRD